MPLPTMPALASCGVRDDIEITRSEHPMAHEASHEASHHQTHRTGAWLYALFEPSAAYQVAMLARAECAADATAHHASARRLWRER
jgi:hypothetical protein